MVHALCKYWPMFTEYGYNLDISGKCRDCCFTSDAYSWNHYHLFFLDITQTTTKAYGTCIDKYEANISRERNPGRPKIAFHRILGLQMSCVFPSFVPSVHSQNVVKFPYMFCGSNFSSACHKREGTKCKKLTRLKQDERASPEIQKCVSWYLPWTENGFRWAECSGWPVLGNWRWTTAANFRIHWHVVIIFEKKVWNYIFTDRLAVSRLR